MAALIIGTITSFILFSKVPFSIAAPIVAVTAPSSFYLENVMENELTVLFTELSDFSQLVLPWVYVSVLCFFSKFIPSLIFFVFKNLIYISIIYINLIFLVDPI